MPTAQPLRTGDPQRLGEYVLSGRLGEGGQGAVFLGSRGGQTYAVKLLHGPVGDERAAFLREVELAKHVARFCTAQVIDAGFDEGRPYIVSEYVDGPSLAREVTLTGPRHGGALERLAVSTATALAAIHRAGIVHRDFKPQNVLLGSDGPRVIDFGLAKALDAAATVSGRGVGTPAYMAPEQITAMAVTGAADVFSWGATMCFAANATAPFGQDSVAPVLHRILTAQPELGRLEGRLRALVESCLDKDARNRPSSRELLFELLGESAEGVPPEVLRSPPPHILRAAPPLVPEQRSPETGRSGDEAGAGAGGAGAWAPMAEPEATGAMGDAYRLPPDAAGPGGGPASRPPQADDLRAVTHPPGAPGGRGGTSAPHAGWAGSGGGAGGGGAGHGQGGGIGAGAGGSDGFVLGGRPDHTRGWPRAAIAVCAALLATAAVLLLVIIPTMNADTADLPAPQAGGGPLTSVLSTSTAPAQTQNPPPAKPEQQASRGPQEPASDPPTVVPPVTVAIPALIGMDRTAATKALKRAGLTPGSVTERDSAQPIGRVLTARPAPGMVVNQGTKVSLQVSAGLKVPALTGMQRGAAEATLTGAGLKVGAVTRSCSRQPAGEVLSTRPKAARRVAGGTAVDLTVSRNGVPVPSVTGRQREDARGALVGSGLSVQVTEQMVEDESRVDTVLAQSRAPGGCVEVGAEITITVGVAPQSGPDPGETTPSPTATATGPIAGE
ncbi:PASTA domain-containing protein [Nonomuraea sp. PA05]|uniref:serine/threonine-protein kinase n=1 Tax=Nonomuraea sp. PA05 TaxID=2604466 RepID=UPI0011D34779|nr:serine/threonine-protein kinase [Nonomuraea sp. PA05]TYB61483.1 PASTA domain-containing protein [Nonomuraea sp. PA05]